MRKKFQRSNAKNIKKIINNSDLDSSSDVIEIKKNKDDKSTSEISETDGLFTPQTCSPSLN